MDELARVERIYGSVAEYHRVQEEKERDRKGSVLYTPLEEWQEGDDIMCASCKDPYGCRTCQKLPPRLLNPCLNCHINDAVKPIVCNMCPNKKG